ncbi:hypothetical protein O181_034733 [Austropuccinia psidii MF-1]|uniref:2,5-diamino-6-ribosylamino-4(3H)-pyrimidinone 5'-phosphate reductase n=1 Tax=Austropuccinia psidii MF-1 TaxID=1389203 RepID=A0A9Q3D430_9BASI|nr:hypothetical protein [Austropuccinia psidii MF-1]
MPSPSSSSASTSSEILDFLKEVYQSSHFDDSENDRDPIDELGGPGRLPSGLQRPFVTLTYAQSLDGKIAGSGGRQLRLSGNPSLKMTHLLRAKHDGILVGVGTVLNDDPQLTARNLAIPVPLEKQPQPIVLDTSLRTPPDCKLIRNYQNQTGKQPWFICARSAISLPDRQRLEGAGARVIPIINAMNDSKDGLDLEKVLQVCKINRINRLMIEGGSAIISSFLNHVSNTPLLNILIITVSPYIVGEGVGIHATSDSLCLLRHVQTRLIGSDSVFAYTTSSGIE